MLNKYAILAFILPFLIHNLSVSALLEEEENVVNTPDDCLSNSLEVSWLCRGSRAVNNILNNLSKSDKPLVIFRGLEIVPSSVKSVNSSNNNNNNNYSDNGIHNDVTNTTTTEVDDDTLVGRFARYLRTHELNLKFSELMADEREQILARDLELDGMQINHEARKKDKGNGMIMVAALMFSKMMAVMGLGGIGALAMKALGVAMAALMMAALIGIKSLGQGGHESTHSVQYVDGHHHHRRRRRRSLTKTIPRMPQGDIRKTALPLAYRGWQRNYLKPIEKTH